jgi:hypothetical protein
MAPATAAEPAPAFEGASPWSAGLQDRAVDGGADSRGGGVELEAQPAAPGAETGPAAVADAEDEAQARAAVEAAALVAAQADPDADRQRSTTG